MKKKFFSILLSLAMVITMMPIMTFTAYAEDKNPNWGYLSKAMSGGTQLSVDGVIEVDDSDGVRTIKLLTDIKAGVDDGRLATNSSKPTVILDLNGHILDRGRIRDDGTVVAEDANGSVIAVGSNTKLTVKDSNPDNSHRFKVLENGLLKYDGVWETTDTETESLKKVNGGVITGGSASNGGGLYVNGSGETPGEFKITGGNIIGNITSGAGGGVYIYYKGIFSIDNGIIIGNIAENGGGVYVSSGTFAMNNGNISDNNSTEWYGGGVHVGAGATFTMNNGNISDNNSSGYGAGGVYVKGTFTMNNGSISGNNTSGGYAGGVSVTNSGTFIMNNGNISDNNSSGYGAGGIYNQGTTNIKDGNICHNTATSKGGGIFIHGGSFTINRGSIYNNEAELGGGVYSSTGQLTMDGGSICNNTAKNYGGVYYGNSENNFRLGGKAIIQNNIADGSTGDVKTSNVHLVNNYLIELISGGDNGLAPAEGMSVGVTLTSQTDGVFTTENDNAGDYVNYFSSDDNTKYVKKTDDNKKLQIIDIPESNYSININFSEHGVVYSDKQYAQSGDTVTLTTKPNEMYYLKSLKVNEQSIRVTDSDTYTFNMPDKAVQVSYEFTHDHQYKRDDVTYLWNNDYTKCTALHTCIVEGCGHQEFETVDAVVEGDKITASFTKPGFEKQEIDKPATEYTVTVNPGANGNAIASTEKATAGSTVRLLAVPNAGYKFKEWKVTSPATGGPTITNNAFTMPASNVTVEATWEAIPAPASEYTVTVNPGEHGTAIANKGSAVSGEAVTLLAVPNDGYKFKEWKYVEGEGEEKTLSSNAYTMTNKNVTFTATWEEIEVPQPTATYDITVTTDGHGSALANYTKAASGTAVNLLAVPNSGYEFDKWVVTDPSTGGPTVSGNSFTMGEAAVTVKATFKAITLATEYTVTLDANGGGSVLASTEKATQGATVRLLAVPDATHTFAGWEVVSPTGGNKPIISGDAFTMPASDVEIKAKWNEIPAPATKYTITVNSGDHGTAIANKGSAVSGEAVTLLAVPNDGYKFKEWKYVEGEGEEKTLSSNAYTMTNKNVTFTATWEEIEVPQPTATYDITVTTDGHGSALANYTKAASGTAVNLLAVPNSGYEFDKWEVSAGGIEVTGNAFTMGNEDVTVKATFKAITLATEYTVTLDANGGGSVLASTEKATQGTTVRLLAVPDATHTFAGWEVVSPTGGNEPIISGDAFTMPASNVEIKAKWNEIPAPATKYTITVNSGDHGTAIANKGSAVSGEAVTLLAVPNSGYEFDGWDVTSPADNKPVISSNAFTMPASNVTINANWKVSTVPQPTATTHDITVTTDGHGSALANYSKASIGTVVNLLAVPNTGYKFDKWEVSAGGVEVTGNAFIMGEADVTIKAKFKVVSSPSPTTPQTDKEQFEAYKVSAKADFDKILGVEDSPAVQELIANARAEMLALQFDQTKSLDENKAKVNAIVSNLKIEVRSQRDKETVSEVKVVQNKLKAYAGKKIKISFKRTTWDEKLGKKISDYQVYRSAKKSEDFKKVATLTKKTSSTITYYNKKDLKYGKKYYYKVRGRIKLANGKYAYTKWSSVRSVRCK